MRALPTIALITIILFLSLGFVPNGEGREQNPRDHHPPVILSENAYNKVLRLSSPPSPSVSILYDQWEIILFGEVNSTYTVKINAVERFNGTFDHEYQNLSFDASPLYSARVVVRIGNKTYQWTQIIVQHDEIYFEGPNLQDGAKKFTTADITKARLRTGFGVILTSLITIPFIWRAVKSWRKRQGVRKSLD